MDIIQFRSNKIIIKPDWGYVINTRRICNRDVFNDKFEFVLTMLFGNGKQEKQTWGNPNDVIFSSVVKNELFKSLPQRRYQEGVIYVCLRPIRVDRIPTPQMNFITDSLQKESTKLGFRFCYGSSVVGPLECPSEDSGYNQLWVVSDNYELYNNYSKHINNYNRVLFYDKL